MRENVRQILRHARDFEWSVQGFGMFRCYLDDRVRVHVWDHRFKVHDVSVIHDHPWDFESAVMSGRIRNTVWKRYSGGRQYLMVHIQCGPGGGQRSEPVPIFLVIQHSKFYSPGDRYQMKAQDLHTTIHTPGTVTLVTRDFVEEDRDHATICYSTREWVSAEPRPAEPHEVVMMSELALERWSS